MKNRAWAAGAATLALMISAATESASAEETLRATQEVSCTPDGASCTQFQGYVYVRRGGSAAAPPAPAAPPAFDGRRLYLHLGAAESR